MPEARGWDEELPKGVSHASEWIAAGFPTAHARAATAEANRRLRRTPHPTKFVVVDEQVVTRPDFRVLALESFLPVEPNPDSVLPLSTILGDRSLP